MASWCLQTEPLFFHNPFFCGGGGGGHQWDPNAPLLGHVGSSGSTLWLFSCQKKAILSLFVGCFVHRSKAEAAMLSWCLQIEPLVFHSQWDINGMQMSHC